MFTFLGIIHYLQIRLILYILKNIFYIFFLFQQLFSVKTRNFGLLEKIQCTSSKKLPRQEWLAYFVHFQRWFKRWHQSQSGLVLVAQRWIKFIAKVSNRWEHSQTLISENTRSLHFRYLRDKSVIGDPQYTSSMVYSCWEDRRADEYLEIKVKCIDLAKQIRVELTNTEELESISRDTYEKHVAVHGLPPPRNKKNDALNETKPPNETQVSNAQQVSFKN